MEEKIKLIGINVGSGKKDPFGRGNFESKTGKFSYIPLNETESQKISFTYKDLNIPNLKGNLDEKCHYDPEFNSFTYGHVKRGFGDDILYNPRLLYETKVYLFFYATLNIDNNPNKWGIFIIGFFEIEKIINVKNFSSDEIFALNEFKNNAHLKREIPAVDLLIKGNNNSRLFTQAILLSEENNPNKINSKFSELITTSSGKKIINKGWHRWIFYSEKSELAKIITEQK